jgi:AbrB family looped-hinge helix DNA binding protein
MSNIGVTRTLDDLGRVVVPKTYRELLNIHPGDEIEFLMNDNNTITVKKHTKTQSKEDKYREILESIAELVNQDEGLTIQKIKETLLNTLE